METHNIHNLNTYIDYHSNSNGNSSKSVPSRKTTNVENDRVIHEIQKDLLLKNSNTKDNHTQHLKLPISYIQPFLETKITLSVEKDLNIIVTTVKNKNTDKVIRQIPSEEIVERLKYIKKYNKQLISQKENNESNIITKDF